jgi:hypothetical protein
MAAGESHSWRAVALCARGCVRTFSFVVEAKLVLLAVERRVPFTSTLVAVDLSPWIIRRILVPALRTSRARPTGLRLLMLTASHGDGGDHVQARAADLHRQEGQEQKQPHLIAAGAHASSPLFSPAERRFGGPRGGGGSCGQITGGEGSIERFLNQCRVFFQ